MNFIPPCQIVGSEDVFNPGCLGRNVFIPAVDRDAVPVDLYICKVVAGFPSPADDYVEKSLDLNELLIKRPAATFFVRVEGDSMLDAGIHPDDILVVDRSLTPDAGKIVVCALNGELTVKRLAREDQQWRLVAANPDYPDIAIHEGLETIIWGVVTASIHLNIVRWNSMQPLIALVDCNNFYASCERLFRPDLHNKPVAVLSNNDGCIVARSAEVKALGIKMGIPVFKVQHLIEQHQVQLFSSNYSLYADLSARVMTILEEFTPSLEVYSIDEAFLDLTGVCSQDPVAYGQWIRQTINRETGIPVCVGMGPTKTLAKLASFAAKKWKKTGGVLDLSDPLRREKLMKIVPVGEVWGIGSRTTEKLNQFGIRTVWELANQPTQQIQVRFSVVVARTVMELNGITCLAIEEIAPNKQQIVCSRSFKHAITTFDALMMAIARFCARAAEKLRWQQSLARRLSVFIRTSPFKPDEPHYERTASRQLLVPSQDTRYLVAVSRQLLEAIFKPGYAYQKAGVQLDDFQSMQETCQQDMFSLSKPDEERLNHVELMAAMDLINQRFPKAVTVAATGLAKSLGSANDHVSPCYTTCWEELPKVKC